MILLTEESVEVGRRSDMLDATAPPFDPVDLEPALRPFGQSRMLPRDAYTSQRVFAFEQVSLLDVSC
jgi:hypothetical protein